MLHLSATVRREAPNSDIYLQTHTIDIHAAVRNHMSRSTNVVIQSRMFIDEPLGPIVACLWTCVHFSLKDDDRDDDTGCPIALPF